MNTKDLEALLRKISLLVMDVDGTLTDAAMFYSAKGEELKRFSTRDGMGINLLHKGGLETAIITSENSPIVRARAKKLNIRHVVLGCHNKTDALKRIIDEMGISADQAAYIGDDVNDYHVMKICGCCACPADATETIRSVAHYICSAKGGHGAVREFAERILLSQNKAITLTENW
jgi:YrbI family 3-deoxy-D-manno-octulosonate 8-phosphate phosphatase